MDGLEIRVTPAQLKNAVRDVVNKMLSAEQLRSQVDEHVEKIQKRLEERATAELETISIPKERMDRWISNRLDRDMDRKIRDAVDRKVGSIIKEQVSIAVRHIVETGVTLQIGTGWNQTVSITTEDAADLKEGEIHATDGKNKKT